MRITDVCFIIVLTLLKQRKRICNNLIKLQNKKLCFLLRLRRSSDKELRFETLQNYLVLFTS